jgi:hypothetical protein
MVKVGLLCINFNNRLEIPRNSGNFSHFSVVVMKRIYSFCVIIILSLLIGCEEKKDVFFSERVFNIGYSVLIGEEELLDPWDILLIDSVLIIANDQGQPAIEIYNLQGNVSQKFLTLGHGPEEVLQIGNLQEINHNLFVYDLFQKKFLEYDYNKIIKSIIVKPDNIHNYSFVSKDSTQLINKLLIGDDCLIGLLQVSASRVALMDTDGNVLSRGGDYPAKTIPELSDYENARLYGSSLILNQNQTKVALATFRADMIDIFDISDKSVKTVWSYQGFLPHDFNVVQMGDTYRTALTDESQYGYADVASSNKYIYAIYSGRLLKDKNYSYGNIIRAVSWDGKKKFELHTDVDINRLTVSKDDKVIYAIAKDENDDPVVIVFDISETLQGIL